MCPLLLVSAALAEPYVGLDYAPFGRGDLVAAEDQASGTLLGELDGLLTPPLTAWGGVTGDRAALLGGAAVGTLVDTTYAGTAEARSVRGALRLSLDGRYYLKDRVPSAPLPYLQLGLYGAIPWAWDTASDATAEEQAALDEQADADRGRIGGYGLRLGAGAEIGWESGVFVGGRWLVAAHQGRVTDESGLRVSTWILSEAALTLGVAL